jgi:L-ribulose-5-phosphate 3-epimerase
MEEYVLGLYEKAMPETLSWKEKLTAAKTVGYDFIEMSIDETDIKLDRLEMENEERLKLIETMYEVGLPIRSMCLSGHRKYPLGSNDPGICARGMEIMEKAILLADDLGIRIIQLAGYDVYYEQSTQETVERFNKNLEKAAIMAACRGISLAFETMETEFMNTVGKAMAYIERINSPYLNIYPDSGNITNAAVTYCTDVLSDISSGAGHIMAMHLKETTPGVFREVPYGTGHVRFDRIIEQAWDMGIRRYVTEFWYQGKSEWMKELYYAHDKMRKLLDRQISKLN